MADYEIDDRVDITDVVCPMTFVKAKVAMEELEIGQVLAVTMNDGEPVQNVPRSFKEEGQQILKLIDNENGTYDLIENKHFILRLAVNIVMQLPEAFALAIFAYRGRKGTQCLASADIRCKGMCRDGRYGFLGQLFLQHLQFFFQCFSSLNLLPERIHLFCRNILLPALLVLCPAVIEIHIAVDRLLCDRPSRQLCNLLLQLCYMGLDFG